MPVVEVKVYPPEFRWGEAPADNMRGAMLLIRGLTANDDIGFNTTTSRYIPLGTPLQLAAATADEATFLCNKPIQIHTLAMLFDTAFAGGAGASFAFNKNGSTESGIELDIVTGSQSAVATGLVTVARLDELCLECTASSGGPPNIRAIAVAYRTRAGDDSTV